MSDDVAAFGTYALSPRMERLRRMGQGLGRGAVARRACSVIRRVVTGGRPGPFDVEPFPGQKARLYPGDNLSEKRVFGGAQFWDWAERAALGRAVQAADEPVYVVDAGANAGLYTLAVRAEAGTRDVRILAIEPDPENLSRLRFNVLASDAGHVVNIAPVALSDTPGEIRIAESHANRGELSIDSGGVPVPARTLLDVIDGAGYPRVDALKIDIEGMEGQVLAHFFAHAPRKLWPGMVILEARRGQDTPALRHVISLGYDIEERTRMNVIARAPVAATDPERNTGETHGKA